LCRQGVDAAEFPRLVVDGLRFSSSGLEPSILL
jgi:hypothetical protein